MKTLEQPAGSEPGNASATLVEPTEDEQYRQHVASLFTAPFLTADVLLEHLAKYWPGDAHENLHGLVTAHYVEVAPTGRYRLPLPLWDPGKPAEEPLSGSTAPAPAAAAKTANKVIVSAPLSRPASSLPETAAGPAAPKFKPLRLAISSLPA